jgi:hypothetical protein
MPKFTKLYALKEQIYIKLTDSTVFAIRVESSPGLGWADYYIEPDKRSYLLCEHVPADSTQKLFSVGFTACL